MKKLIENLPYCEREYLSTEPASVLDWGCAFGEGVHELGQAFPGCRVVGLDFAQRVIGEAAKQFPNHEFCHTRNGRIEECFDVVITSNCLEHFIDPFSVMRQHLESCRLFYVVMVPYREAPLHPQHRWQFCRDCFSKNIGGFRRLACKVIKCNTTYWPGKQILVVYGSEAYCSLRENLAPRILKFLPWRVSPVRVRKAA